VKERKKEPKRKGKNGKVCDTEFSLRCFFCSVCVQAGAILSNLKSMNDVFDGMTLVKLMTLAFAALIPIFIKRKIKKFNR
jgi:hypothetical protein